MTAPLSAARVFLIEMDAAPDALLRVLGPFALQGATVTGLDLNRRDGRMELRVEAEGVEAQAADQLGRRLEALPIVRTVGVGWRAA